ncbi:MAG: cysteine synthase A [Elusimicrobiota bacterium]|nr:cysteine synthase A [Elusimicrobiota bacterium]
MNIAKNMTELVGNTPMVKLNRIARESGAMLIAKLEFFNPAGSVKDRIGLSMIEAAEKEGKLKEGSYIVEPTSGNTGIALAWIAAVKGYRCVLTMPENMSIERRKILQAFGAEIVLTPAEEGMKGAIDRAIRIESQDAKAFLPQQFKNPANPAAHREGTAEEILKDTGGKVDAVIVGVGTGGTITGLARKLKKEKPQIKIIAVEPEESPVLSGGAPGPHSIQGLGAGFIPEIVDLSKIDEVLKVSGDEAVKYTRKLARMEGIFAGISSGAAVKAALKIGGRKDYKDKTVVVILPDLGERYLSTDLFLNSSA